MVLSHVIRANWRRLVAQHETQKALAARINEHEPTLSRWVQGRGLSSLDNMGRALTVGGISPLELLQLPGAAAVDHDAAEIAALWRSADAQTQATVRHILLLAVDAASSRKGAG